MKKTKTLNLLIVLLTMFALTSCAFIQKTNKRKQIVTTLYPEYDMINKIIGTNQETKDLFDVTLIIPPGQDSHTFDPSIQDLITIKNADIFIYTADEMETWVKDVDFGTDTIVIDLSKDSYKKTDDVDKTSRIKLFQVEDDDDDEEPGKSGKVTIHRDNKKNTLTLITCSQTDKTKQIVYILELESEENYE